MPGEPVLVIPNRVDMSVLHSLEEILGGKRTITWLVEDSLRPEAEILNYMKKKRAGGMLFSTDPATRERLITRIRGELAAGHHVVLLPGKLSQPAACHADVTVEQLHYLLDEYPFSVLPVYAGMYNPKKAPLVVSHAPYEKLIIRLLPMVPAGPRSADGVLSAWLEASALQVSQLVENSTDTLQHALLRSLLAHPHSCIIDGVDDTRMTYRHLLFLAAPMARLLRKHTASKRMGIILPPGKLSIISNVACILAGITPVNIDYTYSRKALERVIKQADLTRFITEHCFIDMQQQFPWPRQRDILFTDEILAPVGYRVLSRWNLLSRFFTPRRISKWIRTPDISAQDEALAFFTPAEEGIAVRGVSLSHRAVLTGAALSRSRFGTEDNRRVLSSLPYHYNAGLLAGLIHPLLMGQDIITYPISSANKRLCHLAKQYEPTLAVFSSSQARDALEHGEESPFSAILCFHMAGKTPAPLLYENHHVPLYECYMPLESAMPLSCSAFIPDAEPNNSHHFIPTGKQDTVGMLLPGIALRIMDLNHPDTPSPLSSPGQIRIKASCLASGYLGQGKDGLYTFERWYSTGDVGWLDPQGLLIIGGPQGRYSKVRGEVVSHEDIEQAICKVKEIEEEPGKPLIAIVGLSDGGDAQLILLSTVPKKLAPQHIFTLRYDLGNAHHPPQWTPHRIVILRAIPTLPDGRIDYALCQALARKALDTPSS